MDNLEPDKLDHLVWPEPNQSIFSRTARQLFANGYRGLIRLRPFSKIPCAADWNTWNMKSQTQRNLEISLTKARYAAPETGIGMCSGNGVAGIDLDILDPMA